VPSIHSEEGRIIINKDKNGNFIAWWEIHISKAEIVDVSANRNINTITTKRWTTVMLDSMTFFGKPLLWSAFL
jgi:hypothetical protein